MSKGGLGRGLSSLIPPKQSEATVRAQVNASSPDLERVSHSQIAELPLAKIRTNDYQPRRNFDQRALQELADSIHEHGLLEPIVVRRDGEGWQIIAGERRFRAHQLLKRATVPAIIREADELERLELALIENIQREDLNPIELAQSYKALTDEFGLTQQDAAKRLGVARSSFANCVRYLELPSEIQQALSDRRITEGHAKILLGLGSKEEQMTVFQQLMSGSAMSVRELEDIVAIKKQPRRAAAASTLNIEIVQLENALQEALGTKVKLQPRGKGRFVIAIETYSGDELKQITKKILRP
jgi:ParB family transcriptional regulator, chromosome partitioning protein